MKVRSGFVSNSSSSSFCLVGMWVNEDQLSTGMNFEDAAIDVYGSDYNQEGGAYLGLDFADMRKDETRQEFEDRIATEIMAVTNLTRDQVSIAMICEEYYC